MFCTIENLTARPVFFTLASGQTLRLSPGEISTVLRDIEVVDHPKIRKLQDQRIIAVYDVGEVDDTVADAEEEVADDTATPVEAERRGAMPEPPDAEERGVMPTGSNVPEKGDRPTRSRKKKA